MVNKKFNVENMGQITISDKDYLASGGEASIYKNDKFAIKIYHSKKQMLSLGKIKELQEIKDKNVLLPKNVVYQGSTPVGYLMDFKPNTHCLCKLFTKTFKDSNKISHDDISSLVGNMQETVKNIHKAKCLVVDFNELNELVSSSFKNVYFIDVDSYQTPSFRATAIMENIRDRLIKNNQWNEGSGWFSFAILSFQMWIGIHPYKGKHPDFKSSEWGERMEKGISVFDKNAVLPRTCNNISVIPNSHLRWFKDVFENKTREEPPKVGEIIAVVAIPTKFKIIPSNKSIKTELKYTCPEKILKIFNFVGVNYVVGKKHLYKENVVLPIDISDDDKTIMCSSDRGDPIVCSLKNDLISFKKINGDKIGEIGGADMILRNNNLYSFCNGKIIENVFTSFGSKILHAVGNSYSVMPLSTKLYKGMILQDILGKKYFTIPYKKGSVANVYIPELDSFRVLDACSDKNVCAVIAERKGEYCCFVFTFEDNFEKYICREIKDVQYLNVNFTVLNNGVCVFAKNTEVEIFIGKNIKVVDNPPFDSTTQLLNISNEVFYVEDNELISVKMS